MSSLNELAFPFIEPSNNETGSISLGFTKHQYAAVLIASQLAGQTHHKEWSKNDTSLIADFAYELAKDVLNKF